MKKIITFNQGFVPPLSMLAAGEIFLPKLGMMITDNVSKELQSNPAFQSQVNDHAVQAIFYPQKNPQKKVRQRNTSDKFTWGLSALGLDGDHYSAGAGVNLCVLDTGFYPQHPDFKNRNVVMESFVDGESATDGHGHGTHCIGTAAGYKNKDGYQYGIAYKANILAGKVLSNRGGGTLSGILRGMEWALEKKAHIISMSLGNTSPSYNSAYEEACSRALDHNCLVIAAAGNHRPGTVGQPANSPSALAVGAIDSEMRLASFSCGSGEDPGSEVGVVAPGVGVYSSTPSGYSVWNGTSMATPHVSGLAAVYIAEDGITGRELRDYLESCAYYLDDIDETDQGFGLVHY